MCGIFGVDGSSGWRCLTGSYKWKSQVWEKRSELKVRGWWWKTKGLERGISNGKESPTQKIRRVMMIIEGGGGTPWSTGILLPPPVIFKVLTSGPLEKCSHESPTLTSTQRVTNLALRPNYVGTSLVAQWLRIHLPMQGTWEDPTCCGATNLVCHNYWACVPQLLKPAHLEWVLRNRNEKPTHHNKE